MIVIAIIVCVVLISSGVGAYFYIKKQKEAEEAETAVVPTTPTKPVTKVFEANNLSATVRSIGAVPYSFDMINGHLKSTNPTASGQAGLGIKLPEPVPETFTFEYEMYNTYIKPAANAWALTQVIFTVEEPTNYYNHGLRISFNEGFSRNMIRYGKWDGDSFKNNVTTVAGHTGLTTNGEWTTVRVIRTPNVFQVWVKPQSATAWFKYMEYNGTTYDDFKRPFKAVMFLDSGVWTELRKRNFTLYDGALLP